MLKTVSFQLTDAAERQCFEYLQKFIHLLDFAGKGTFLMYVTGRDIMHEIIEVSFTSMDGFARRLEGPSPILVGHFYNCHEPRLHTVNLQKSLLPC